MKKGQRPGHHFRRVGKRKLPKLINPAIAKKIPNKKYKLILKQKLGPNADADGDGVKNKNDCYPFNEKKQDSERVLRELKRREEMKKKNEEGYNQIYIEPKEFGNEEGFNLVDDGLRKKEFVYKLEMSKPMSSSDGLKRVNKTKDLSTFTTLKKALKGADEVRTENKSFLIKRGNTEFVIKGADDL